MSLVQINQSPTLPNGTQADLIFTHECPNSADPQFRYICRVKEDTAAGDAIAQFKLVPNNSGLGVFEVSRILDNAMGYDLAQKTIGFVASTNNNIRTFEIAFGAQSGSTATSALSDLSIDVSASLPPDTIFIPAVVERDAGSFNWDSTAYDVLTNCPNTTRDTNGNPTNILPVSSSDWLTISTLQGTIGNKGDLSSMRIDFYNSSNSSVYNYTEANGVSSGTTAGSLVHVGVGPKNIETLDATIASYLANPTSFPYYSVKLTYASGTSKTYYFENKCYQYKGTNFAFINKLGMFDYYRASLVDTENESFNRETFDKSYINYSTDTTTISYDYTTRGETQYYNSLTNTYTAETDWLTTEQANWLFELFESPSVYVQDGNNFIGVVITNANEQYKTNQRGQKVFKFTIQYRKSNSKRART